MNAQDDGLDELDGLERVLRSELGAADRAVTPPHVDVVGVARAGRRERRRRTGLTVAAAAAVAAIAVGTVALVPGDRDTSAPLPADRPESVADLPVGAPSPAPRVTRRVLHAGGTTYAVDRVDLLNLYFAGGTTVATVKRDGTWRALVLRDGEARELVAEPGGAYPPFRTLVSADGRWVAVAQRPADEPAAVDLSRYDVRGGQLSRPMRFSGHGLRSSFSLLNVTADGRILFGGDQDLMWAPGETPVEVARTGSMSVGQISYPGGMAQAATRPDGDYRVDLGHDVYGTISADGTFEQLGETSSSDVSWSPTGATWAAPTLDGEWEVYVEAPDRDPEPLLLPEALQVYEVVGWEDERSVVLEGTERGLGEVQVRCDAVDLTCEQLPEEGQRR